MNHVKALEDKLKSTRTTSYDGIDKLMHKIANAYGISVVKLHNDFVKVNGEKPDSWIKKKLVHENFDVLKKPKTLNQISDKHKISLNVLELQLKVGIGIEHEHTKNEKTAMVIALHHLWEDPFYYKKLKKLEKKSFREFYGR